MLYSDEIDISEKIDFNKTSKSKECDICQYWYFLHKIFEFQLNVCNRCHDLLMMSMNLSDVAILKIKGSDYHCIISAISKSETINLIQNKKLTKTAEHYKAQKILFYSYKRPIFQIHLHIEKVLVSNKIFLREKKTINTLLVTCIMIIKLSHFM